MLGTFHAVLLQWKRTTPCGARARPQHACAENEPYQATSGQLDNWQGLDKRSAGQQLGSCQVPTPAAIKLASPFPVSVIAPLSLVGEASERLISAAQLD